MKLFTKIALGIAGFFLGIGLICAIIAFSLGLTTDKFMSMVNNGAFSFRWGDDNVVSLFDGDDKITFSDGDNEITFSGGNDTHHSDDLSTHHEEEGHYESSDVTETCTKLDVEYGAGRLEIHYSDTEQITVDQTGVVGFYAKQDGDTLYVEGHLDVIDNSNATLIICIPEGMEFEEVDLEIGASQAEIGDLVADELNITVGAGQANISNIKAEHLNLEVGAGQASVTGLQVQNLDIEAGVGEINVEVMGAERNYNYNVECGMGEVNVGNNSYGGLGAEQDITNPGAECRMDIECGIGKVNVKFTE